jgi:GAF domain-containing protein
MDLVDGRSASGAGVRAHSLDGHAEVDGVLDLGDLARALHARDAQLEPTVEAVLALAVATIAPAAHAGVVVLRGGRLEVVATSGRPPHELDLLQQRVGRGPCLHAAREQQVVEIADTATEQRWPEFARHARGFEVASVLCVPLWVDRHRLGALTLYSDRPGAFDERDRALTDHFAAFAALALAAAERGAQLRQAAASRDVIGQAKGILMERHRITAEAAWEQLSRASQDSNRKLIEVANDLVETGVLPGR